MRVIGEEAHGRIGLEPDLVRNMREVDLGLDGPAILTGIHQACRFILPRWCSDPE